MAESTYYEILGVAPTATSAEVKAKYRTLTTKVHPDQGGPTALFILVQEAYETLSDPTRRAAYDASLTGAGPPAEADTTASPDSGWVRVDDPTPTPEPPPSGPSGAGDNPGASPPPAGFGTSYAPPSAAPATVGGGHALSFVSRHPSGAVATTGLVLLWMGIGLHSGLALLGLMALIVGGTGVVGTRRAQAADNLRRSGMASIDAMTGAQFEMYLEQLFASKGYRVWHSGGRGDFGADLVIDGPGGRTIVQAKRWSAVVGHAAVQEVVAARGHYQGNHAIVVTNSHFSSHAQKLAQSNQVQLWDRERVAYEITQSAALPPTPAAQRFRAELVAGAPVVFRSLLVVFASLSGGKRSKRSRRRR